MDRIEAGVCGSLLGKSTPFYFYFFTLLAWSDLDPLLGLTSPHPLMTRDRRRRFSIFDKSSSLGSFIYLVIWQNLTSVLCMDA